MNNYKIKNYNGIAHAHFTSYAELKQFEIYQALICTMILSL